MLTIDHRDRKPMTQINPDIRQLPPPKAEKPKGRRVTRQRRERLNRDAEYLVLRDIYLQQNPLCVFRACGRPASEVHHVVRGTAGRSRSLLNSDTYLGVCHEHHDAIEKLTPEQQIKLKQRTVRQTIERLRR